MKHTCPVCGFKGLAEPPYDHEGNHSHEICPCCGFQFGFDVYEIAARGWFLFRAIGKHHCL
ncbi:hypothetical protein NRS6120_05960 [Bacillus subtilis]|nr:hypothetical protein NRS6120_05960 [Bacillus subtilis]